MQRRGKRKVLHPLRLLAGWYAGNQINASKSNPIQYLGTLLICFRFLFRYSVQFKHFRSFLMMDQKVRKAATN